MKSYWKEKKVFITGASGFIGFWLTHQLLELGAFVTVLDYEDQRESLLLSLKDAPALEILPGNLQDLSLLKSIFKKRCFDHFFHLAAETQVTKAKQFPLETFETNIRGSYFFLEACRGLSYKPASIVIASTDKVYDEYSTQPFTEETPLEPRFPYDTSKACVDMIARAYYHTYDLPIVITRCANVYGGGDFNWDRLIPSLIRSFIHNERPILRSSGSPVRDYIFISDIVEGYLLLAEQCEEKKLYGEVFNLTSYNSLSVKEVVSWIAKLMNQENNTPLVLDNAVCEIHEQSLSSKKAEDLIGWYPRVSFPFGLEMTISWYHHYFLTRMNSHDHLLCHRS